MEKHIQPRYVIRIAAELVGVRTHTLRYYEREGLVKPSRSSGNVRLYSESDIERLRRVRNLMEELGVNTAGVEVILNMLDRMTEMQRLNEEMRLELARQLHNNSD